jgi:NAD(P)-dependent dehydrogenase (short-subunit alcohol dehydrogenase family)
MNRILEGKVALVTGGTLGVGRGVALALTKAGVKVAICGRNDPDGQAAVKMIGDAGGEVMFVRTDVSKSAQVDQLIARVVERFGRLDIAFNNAGVAAQFRPFYETTEQDYDYTFDSNVRGAYLCMKAEILQMMKQGGGGSIINNSSIQGHIAIATSGHYTASKHAIEGYTKVAALDCAKLGIRVNSVAPGVLSEGRLGGGDIPKEFQDYLMAKHPLGRFGTSTDVAGAVIFLASDLAAYTTGASIPVDGGYMAE